MPTITTAQIKSTLQSAKQSAANKLHSAGQSTKDALAYGSQGDLNPLINEISKIISAAGSFDVKEERTAASLLQLSGNASDFSYGRNSITLTTSA